MPLNTVTTGNTILAADINQLVNVLQKPAGQTESGGSYNIDAASYATGCDATCYYQSQSRNATPVSVSIDESIHAHNTCNAAATVDLTSSGVLVRTTSTAIALKVFVAGLVTIQY